MGVGGGFWEELKPVVRKQNLDSLRGKKLAIDLSYWMIQTLTAVKGARIRKPHIRLLFFRTIQLVAKIGSFPVFVADGDPPPLKLQVRVDRFSRISGLPSNNVAEGTDQSTARNRLFTENIEECVELLTLLGMPVLRAKHEAEGLCAELDRQGLVNACVTPDSDAFLYGAKHVIKNLQTDFRDPLVESYSMADVESTLGLHREHLVALALLAGCDYDAHGVPGVGCHNAIRLIKMVPKHDIFNRLRAWGGSTFEYQSDTNGLNYDSLDSKKGKQDEEVLTKLTARKAPHCSTCGHPGTKKLHSKLGCEHCSLGGIANELEHSCTQKVQGFKCTCEFCTEGDIKKKKVKLQGWQLKMCQKISEARGFPNEEIIKIYMNSEHCNLTEEIKEPSTLVHRPPQTEALERFLAEHLHWDKIYVRQKVLPLLSLFCLMEIADMKKSATSDLVLSKGFINGLYAPHSIQRIKIQFSKPFYQLRWGQATDRIDEEDWLGLKSNTSSQKKKMDDLGLNDADEMAPALQTETVDNTILFTTDEDMTLVRNACPHLINEFEHEQDARRKIKKQGAQRKRIQFVSSTEKQLNITSFFKRKKAVTAIYDTKEDMDMGKQRKSVEVVLIEDANMVEDTPLHPSNLKKTGESPLIVSRPQSAQELFTPNLGILKKSQTLEHMSIGIDLDVTPPSSSFKGQNPNATVMDLDSSLHLNKKLFQASVQRSLF